jgi:DNA-binding MarR family transcriptional regulator
MTSRLDRLVTRGLVTRRADPADGRLVRVRLTAAGQQRVDAAFAALLDGERELLAALDTGRRRELADALRTLLAAAARPHS